MSKVVRTLLSADKDARLKMLGRSALNLAANTNHVTACGPLPDASEVHQLVLPSVCVCACVCYYADTLVFQTVSTQPKP